jgi:hypothetical protein
VVRGSSGVPTYEEAFEETLAAAQAALDLLAMRGTAQLVVEHSDARHIVWWSDHGLVTTRIFWVEDMRISVSASGTVTSASGTPIPDPVPPPLVWHESLRYFRLSQTSADLIEAYRNLYLAMESLLSSMVPQHLGPGGVPNEGEGSWLKRALAAVHLRVPLGPFAPPGASSPVQGVWDDLYAGTRTGVFHAKAGRPVILPHASGDRHKVLQSLERLSRFYLAVVEVHLGFRRPAGLMTYAGFQQATNFPATVVVSDDPAPLSESDTNINPTGGRVMTLVTHSAALNKPGVTYWIGEENVTSVSTSVPEIRRVGLQVDAGVLAYADRFDEALQVDGFDLLQVQAGLRLVNTQMPQFRFAT